MKNILLPIIFTSCLIFSAAHTYAQTGPQEAFPVLERSLDSALVQISKLQPQEFITKRKDNLLKSHYGFQVEQFEKVFPSLVKPRVQVLKTTHLGRSNPGKTLASKEIDYASLVPVLVAAVQEQQALILKQQQQIDALEKLLHVQ